ncbi:MAG TPA: glycosyltransferase, partial [Rhizomicrobium sp.]|nr:glycosyltransferase [Rhizomicrobium sp.]
RLPMAALQARLDEAARRHPERGSLSDFRADPALAAAESEALAAATRIVTPHADIAALFGERALLLDWQTPRLRFAYAPESRRIAFAGPTIARKGAHEVRDAARALGLEIVLMGSELEGAGFWRDVRTTRNIADGVSAFVQPAVIEDKPRKLLAALASGIPVVATRECGIAPREGLTLVPSGDLESLVRALKTALSR